MKDYSCYQSSPLIAELYDFLPLHLNRRDKDFYVDQSKEEQGTILELGCGTGRILVQIAEAGCRIIGLDSSEFMLDRCREKIRNLPEATRKNALLIGDSMTAFDLNEKASLAIIPFRAFQHLISIQDHMACLTSINRNLVPGGRLIFDVFQVDPTRLQASKQMTEYEDTPEFDLPDGRKLRRTNRVTNIHIAEQFNEVELIYYLTGTDGQTERIVQAFSMRYFFRFELEHLLARCGFSIEQMYGNFDRSPLSNLSPEMIIVAAKMP